MAVPGVQFVIARISNLDLLLGAAWGTLGSALLLLGGGVGGALGAVGANSHLWGDDIFLAGFALSCLIGAAGVYVLLAAFFGRLGPVTLPLPRMKFEKGHARQGHHPVAAQRAAPRAEGGVPGEAPPGGGRGGAGGAGDVGGGAGGAGGTGSGGGGGQGGGLVLPVTLADGTVEMRRLEGGRGGRGGGHAGGEGGGG